MFWQEWSKNVNLKTTLLIRGLIIDNTFSPKYQNKNIVAGVFAADGLEHITQARKTEQSISVWLIKY